MRHCCLIAGAAPLSHARSDKEGLGLSRQLRAKVMSKGALLKYSLPTIQVGPSHLGRREYWFGCWAAVSSQSGRMCPADMRDMAGTLAARHLANPYRSWPGMQERVAYWRSHMGFSPAELHVALDRLPRLLLYPVHERKYQDKLAFLRGALRALSGWEGVQMPVQNLMPAEPTLGMSMKPVSACNAPARHLPPLPAPHPPPLPLPADELRLPQHAVLLSFPAFLTYSLPGRIAPRAAAARAFKGCQLPLEKLAYGEAAFINWLKVEPEEYYEWLDGWRRGAGARWVAAAGDDSGGEGDAAAAGGELSQGPDASEEEQL